MVELQASTFLPIPTRLPELSALSAARPFTTSYRDVARCFDDPIAGNLPIVDDPSAPKADEAHRLRICLQQ
jgi:hypothetical protein